MRFECLHDRSELRRYFQRDPWLHIYELGDLDDFFWPRTTWYGSREPSPGAATSPRLEAVALVYAGPELPTLIALGADPDPLAGLLKSVGHLLPDRFYAHLSPGVSGALQPAFTLEGGADHYKMALREADAVSGTDTTATTALSREDAPELQALYDRSYPGNWFDELMLETGQYFGIREGGRLISAAGVHVYSPAERVAALGNIVTDTAHRGRGYGRRVTAAVCKSLLAAGTRIGLNVQADNKAALRTYEALGFEIVAEYGEFTLQCGRP